ncbi:maleylpyruvate isomerase family mycothiol-dependent enzyme [Streptomyces sp. G45]|uniref:maleylpyruvate isomerase family mycothiol-dependent enzyme n=1 Tax=Streptomyces sp. G45 TaxID=3406627 RepID=UPI003C14CDB4
MSTLPYERYCAEVPGQLEGLRAVLRGADLSVTVPTCPDWTLDQLVRHVGGAVRTVELHVRTRATAHIPDADVPGFTGPEGDDPAALDAWLADTAAMFAETAGAAGADTPVWSWAGQATAGFWARRMTHEVAIHRADAAIAVGAPYALAPEVGADALDEWLEIVHYVQHVLRAEQARGLVGDGRVLRLRATDTDPGLGADWAVTLGPDGVAWRRAGDAAGDLAGDAAGDVVLRGPMTEVLLAFYRRRGLAEGRVEVDGDRGLLEFWLERASFG